MAQLKWGQLEALKNLIRNVFTCPPPRCKPCIGRPQRAWSHSRWCVLFLFLTPNKKELRSPAVSSVGNAGDLVSRGQKGSSSRAKKGMRAFQLAYAKASFIYTKQVLSTLSQRRARGWEPWWEWDAVCTLKVLPAECNKQRGLRRHKKTAPLRKHLGKPGQDSVEPKGRSAGLSLESSLEGVV